MERKIYTIGETTYDIIFKQNKPIDSTVGGSQLNTAISLGRLGLPVGFISQFGTDKIGDISAEFLQQNNISLQCISRYNSNSRIALAFLDEQNNAHYDFCKAGDRTKIVFPEIKANDIILFGSSYAVNSDVRSELINFITKARDKGAFIIYDPNFRKSNLHKLAKLKPLIEENFSLAHLVKGSDEDFKNIFSASTAQESFEALQFFTPAPLVYTASKNGVWVISRQLSKKYNVPSIEPVSTIGAGDNFSAGIIFSIYKNHIFKNTPVNEKQWDKIVSTATNFAQHVCMRYENYISVAFAQKISKQPDK